MTCLNQELEVTSQLHRAGWALVVAASLVLALAGSVLATQADTGAGVYKQWCATCHGDQGQGLTVEWRSTWPENEQYCWKSRCHAANHPPDGFSFPTEVPAVIGRDALVKFQTGQDLYYYVRATMPYWSPNLLSDDEYRAVARYLVEANYSVRGLPVPSALDGDLASVMLHPSSGISIFSFSLPSWMPLLVLPIPLVLALSIWVWRRSEASGHS